MPFEKTMFCFRGKLITGVLLFLLTGLKPSAQTNLLLNGGFEDVNVCTEYAAECGVEGWFYLRDVKAQMLANETNTETLGTNSFGIFFNWLGFEGFNPLIGTLLPCKLQAGKTYTFSGTISAKLNPNLIFKTGVCLGDKFYVPKRPFSSMLQPDSIEHMKRVPNTNFMSFVYRFVADGTERFLTFGTYIKQDLSNGKKPLTGTQTVSVVLDNFKLEAEDPKEATCADFMANKETIYKYNFRHKEMDYSLYGRGDLSIVFEGSDSDFITRIQEPPVIIVPDTLKLGDVFFDFNKANLKPAATAMLRSFFIDNKQSSAAIDSLYIEGHTDSIGTDKHNMELSLSRCESIRQWLLQNNVATAPVLQVHPFGKSKPISTNSTPQGRALNRRVEIIIFRKKQP